MVTFGEKYVERIEKALCETVCLEHARQMPMTVDQCWQKIQPLGFSKVDRNTVEDSYKRLERDGHVRKDGDRYTVTDDGREDIQKVETLIVRVVGEFPSNVTQNLRTTPGGSGRNY